MPLTSNREVDHYVDQELRSFQMAAAVHIYKGALVGLSDTGHARPLIGGDLCVGIAYEEMDNSKGDIEPRFMRVYTLGDFGFTLPGATLVDIGRRIFASFDDTVTFERERNSYVGYVQDLVSDGEIILRLETLGKTH